MTREINSANDYFESMLNDETMCISLHEIEQYTSEHKSVKDAGYEDIKENGFNIQSVCHALNQHIKTPKHSARAKIIVSEIAELLLEECAYWDYSCEDRSDAYSAHNKTPSAVNHVELRPIADIKELSVSMGDI